MSYSVKWLIFLMGLVQISSCEDGDRPEVYGMRSCVGSMVLGRWTLQKRSQFEHDKHWSIRKNRIRDTLRIESIEVQGDCCWELRSRQNAVELHSPNDEYPKTMIEMPYIFKITAKNCPE